MISVRLGRFARADVRKISTYLFHHGFDASVHRRFLAAFETTCLRLADSPLIGQVVASPQQPSTQRRKVVMDEFPKYLVFYRVSASAITIERVLHGAQNLPSLLRQKDSDG